MFESFKLNSCNHVCNILGNEHKYTRSLHIVIEIEKVNKVLEDS